MPLQSPICAVAINSLLPTLERLWDDLKAAAVEENIALVTVGFLLLAALLVKYVPAERRRIRAAALLFAFSLFLILVSSIFASAELESARTGARRALAGPA